jgi:hypothetical protein
MKTIIAIILTGVTLTHLGCGAALLVTNEVYRTAVPGNWEISVVEEQFPADTNMVRKPMEIPPGVTTRYADQSHYFRFYLHTNTVDAGSIIWERGDSSFSDDLKSPYQVLDVYYNRTNLAILYRRRGREDFCDIVDLNTKTGLTYQQAKLLHGSNPLNKPFPESLEPLRLPGKPRIERTKDGYYEVVSEWARDLGKTAYDPTRQIMRRISNWETNHVVFRFNGQNWDLLTTNLWATPKHDD